MEYLNEYFGEEPELKTSSEEARERWRNAINMVKNPRRRFRRIAQAAMRIRNQEKLRISILLSRAAFQFIEGVQVQPSEYTVPEEVKAAGFQICADELGSIVKEHDIEKLQFHGGVAGIAKKLSTSIESGIAAADNDLINHRREIYGINQFSANEPQHLGVFVRKALQDMTFGILVLFAFLSLIVDIAMDGWPNGADDGLRALACILLVVFSRALSGYRQSSRSKQKEKIDTLVTRNGYRRRISV